MSEEKYISVSTENLKVNTIPNFNIFIQPKDHRIILFRKKSHPFTEETLNRLIDNKIRTIFVSEDEMGAFEDYFHTHQENDDFDLTKKDFASPFDKPENVEKHYKLHSDYYPIGTKTLIPGSKVDFNVYEINDFDTKLFFGPESQNDKPDAVPEDIQKNILPIVIQNSDLPLYKTYLENFTREYSKDKELPQELQCSIIQENSKLIVKEVLDDPRNGENIQKSSAVVETLVDTILNNENNFYNLLKITSHDYYTYTHSLNVCTISIGLGTALNLKRYPEITELGLGALLHDIGKSSIDPYILNKPGKLTKDEYDNVKNHVIAGKMLLENSNNKISKNAYIPILQHHEKISGKGYPYKLKGEQIHLFGRIAAIVDFFDALTTTRPYRKAYKPFEALQLMSEIKEDYDEKIVRDFITMLGHQT
ncbi:MAG: HD-GYP domain-containing protein [Candidatus Scalinduaceae bacterium]